MVGPFPEPIDGCSYANQTLLDALRSRGHTVETVDTASRVISARHGKFSVKKVLLFLLAYRGLLRICRAQVVYVTPGQTLLGLIKYAPFMVLAKVLRKPYVIHLHGNHLGTHFAGLKGSRRELFKLCVQGASAGIVLSKSLRANFDGLLPSRLVFIVENFAGEALFASRERSKPLDRLRILYLSNLMREKGVFVLLDALQRLKDRGVDFHARFAGRVEVGMENEFHDAFARLGDSVEYLGPLKGEAKTIALEEANVFVLPTHYPMEGQPIALLEALATGNVVIATDHAGIPDVIGPDQGFLIPAMSPIALADALERISTNLAKTVLRFSESNRAYARGRFTEEAFTERVLTVLNHVTLDMPARGVLPHDPA